MYIRMTQDHLSALLSVAGAKKNGEGWMQSPDGRHITLHAAFNGASLSVAKIEALRVEGGLVQARTVKGDVYVLALSDLFAGAVEGGTTTARKAGFV